MLFLEADLDRLRERLLLVARHLAGLVLDRLVSETILVSYVDRRRRGRYRLVAGRCRDDTGLLVERYAYDGQVVGPFQVAVFDFAIRIREFVAIKCSYTKSNRVL